MKRLSIFIILLICSLPLISQNTARFILKTKNNFTAQRLRKALNLKPDTYISSIFEERNLFLIKINNNKFDYIKRKSFIEYITKDLKLDYRNIPNDPNYVKQYAPAIINAEKMWDFNTGGINGNGDTIVIAVLDNGCEITHKDLKENIWRNIEEIPNDSIDNDDNGYVDDYFGVDLLNGNDQHNNKYHGTSVSGIIGAKGNNNKGITGINWNVKLLLITNVNYISDAIKGYKYVYKLKKKYNDTGGKKGAFIVATNLSMGLPYLYPNSSPAIEEWCSIYNQLGAQGILNVSAAENDPINVEEKGDIPTLCTSDYLIPVTSTDKDDNFDIDRSYGAKSIDIAAPGKNIYTLYSNNGYKENFSGNSAAAPHVAGAIGLLYTIPCKGFTEKAKANPAEMSLLIKKYILEYSDKHPDLTNKTVSGGRLDIYNTYLHLAEDLCTELISDTFKVINVYPNPASTKLIIEYSTDNYNPHILIVYNSIGQKVYQKTFRPNLFGKKTRRIDVKNFASGTYFFKLISGKNSIVKQFVKM